MLYGHHSSSQWCRAAIKSIEILQTSRFKRLTTVTNYWNKVFQILLVCAAKSRTLKYILMVCHGQCSVVITHALGPHFTDLHLNDALSHGKDTAVLYIV